MSSCAEIVYLFFKDCEFKIDKNAAQMLLIGILSDTGNFRFSNDYKTLENAAALMKLGADKKWIEANLFGTLKFNEIKVYGEYMRNMVLDRENSFFYTGIDYETYKVYGRPAKISSKFATTYGAAIDGTNFGIIIYEKEPKVVDISLRGRDGYDISGLAAELGGGGHKVAAGGQINGLSYADAVEKVVQIAKKYAKANKKI
jgi:phosphoesterase RecJ-like protein